MIQGKGLDSRVAARAKWDKVEKRYPTYQEHVRAEVDRLARQIRQLPTTRGMYYDQARSVKLKDVLALLRAAKK